MKKSGCRISQSYLINLEKSLRGGRIVLRAKSGKLLCEVAIGDAVVTGRQIHFSGGRGLIQRKGIPDSWSIVDYQGVEQLYHDSMAGMKFSSEVLYKGHYLVIDEIVLESPNKRSN